MVCPCLRVSQEDIEQAIENGASNFKDVKKKTKIVTKCGKCKNRAKCLVREIFAKQDMIEEAEQGVCLGCQGDFFEPLEGGEEGTKKEKPCKKKKGCKKEKSCIGKKEKKKEKQKKKKEKEKKKEKKAKKKEKKQEKKKKKEKVFSEEYTGTVI